VRSRRLARLGVALALVPAAASCRDSGEGAAPTTAPAATEVTTTVQPTTTQSTSTTTTKPAPPRTTTTIPADIAPGEARISGTVTGPQGLVAGATVRVERLVGDEVATLDVTAANGSFALGSVRGGRYRLRAWKQPDLVQTEPEVFFLAADEMKTVELRVVKVSEVNVQATVDPNPIRGNETFAITLFLYAGSVSDQGVIQAAPGAGVPVQLVLGPGLGFQGPDKGTTDAGGNVTFRASCRASGPQSADAVIASSARVPVALPPCP
jgi:hypothetical protein